MQLTEQWNQAAGADGSIGYSRVVFAHEHLEPMHTVKISVASRVLELTADHQVGSFL